VPSTSSNYVSEKTKYYGPHKRYDYWYTGQNTEILGYEQKIDNQYFLATYTDPENKNDSDTGNTKTAPNKQSDGSKAGTGGTSSSEAINNFRTSLYDPQSFATAKIQILGDPDFIMHDTASVDTSTTGSTSYNKFYDSNGTTVNPTGGQVFIEVNFNEAVDYSRTGTIEQDAIEDGLPPVEGEPGTLLINDSIEFWRFNDPEQAAEVKGIPYQILSVTNSLVNGAFTATISAVINQDLADDSLSDEGKDEAREEGLDTTEEATPTTEAANNNAVNPPPDKPTTNTNPVNAGRSPGILSGLASTNRGTPIIDPQTGQVLGYSQDADT
jgi:hypothetical protein